MHLYLHVPFCARRCSYCDFAIAVRRNVPSKLFAQRVLEEWGSWQEHPAWSDSPTLDTVYFGGGTPSLIEPELIGKLLETVNRSHAIVAGAEITLEANPDDVDANRAAAWQAAGVNRVSLGVQSFEPPVLRWMHRTHTREQVPAAVAALRKAGIENLSLDLIFGLPSELTRDWDADLTAALSLSPDHLSIYGLTVESHTPLMHWIERGETRPAPESGFVEQFLSTHARLSESGFDHYEISNYARPGYRAAHNSAYWKRAPYVGIGPSAHSGLGNERRWNLREWAAYDAALERGESVVAGREMLSESALRLEELYLGLRTTEGLPEARVSSGQANAWIDAGWMKREQSRFRLTPEGWLRLDALVAEIA
jgi:putative oxygen-independent coproporphyrinogen III oxidase